MDGLEPKSKFTMMAEILPQNARTIEIMAQREAIENQKKAEAEEVNMMIIYISTSNSSKGAKVNGFLCVVETA
jgi:hypothetical protein